MVRLCHLAESGELNGWETGRDRRQFTQQVNGFVSVVVASTPVKEADIAARPLAMIQALDKMLLTERRAARFVDRPFEVNGRRYWLVPRTCLHSGVPRLRDQAGSLAHWLPNHVLMHGQVDHVEIKVKAASGGLAQALQVAASAGSDPALKFWVGHFDDGQAVQWEMHSSPSGRMRAVGFSDAAKRRACVLATLERARLGRAQVIVLPELSVDLAMRDAILAWVDGLDPATPAPMLIVAGSFHETLADGCFNTAPLIDALACERLFSHRKLRVYGEIAGDCDTDTERAEAISTGRTMEVLVTAAGAFAVLICKDFLDADASVANLLQRAPVDWVLVPSYGDDKTRKGHRLAADKAAKLTVGCQAVVANIEPVGIGDTTGALPGFAYCLRGKVHRDVPAAGGLVELYLRDKAALPTESTRSSLIRVK